MERGRGGEEGGGGVEEQKMESRNLILLVMRSMCACVSLALAHSDDGVREEGDDLKGEK